MMKSIHLLLLIITLGCQRDKDVNPKAFALLEGKWELVGQLSSEKEWSIVATDGQPDLIVRADGVPLDGDGFGFCCPPKNFLIDGKLYAIEPKTPYVNAPACQLIRCVGCETIELQITQESLLWIGCNGNALHYTRLP